MRVNSTGGTGASDRPKLVQPSLDAEIEFSETALPRLPTLGGFVPVCDATAEMINKGPAELLDAAGMSIPSSIP